MKLKDLKQSARNDGTSLGDGVRVWREQGDCGYTRSLVVSCGGASVSSRTDDAMTDVDIETIRSFVKYARELAESYLAIAGQLDKVRE